MNIQQADVSVVSDLYQAGVTEDGVPFVGEVYFVQVDFVSGERFRHFASWRGVEKSTDEESGWTCFADVRAAAQAEAERLAERVRRAGRINREHWHEQDPAYASDAYIARGIEAERAYADRFQ